MGAKNNVETCKRIFSLLIIFSSFGHASAVFICLDVAYTSISCFIDENNSIMI